MRADRGFTLIEVMVALAVFSLAALALVRLESATIRGAATIDGTFVADMIARNVATEAVTDARVPTLGVVQGGDANGGRRLNWTRTVTPTGDPRIVVVDVAVSDPRGQVLGRATMIRPPDQTAVP